MGCHFLLFLSPRDITKAYPGFVPGGDRRITGMKKTLFFSVVCGLFCAGLAFGAEPYSVRSATGPVHRLGPAGQWIAVAEGDALSPSTIIRIGLNASLVVKNGDTEQILRSARQGALESFLKSGATGSEGRISVGGRAVDSDTSPAISGAAPAAGSSPRTLPVERELDWAE
jgi:hypothetical protein